MGDDQGRKHTRGRWWRPGALVLLLLLALAAFGLRGERGHRVLREAVRVYYAMVGDTGGPLTVVDRGTWSEIEPGLELHRLVVTRPKNLSDVTLVAVRIDPARFALVVREVGSQPAAVRALAEAEGAAVAINGGYFDPSGQPLGLLISDGRKIAGRLATSPGRGVFGVRAGVPFVDDADGLDLTGVTQALQTTPVLVRDGAEVVGFTEPWRVDRRAAVCVDSAGRVIFAATDTLLNGLSFSETAHLMARSIDRGGLGCEDGMTLDGGTSAQLWTVGHPEASVPGYADVPVALLVLPRAVP
jgi:hypothetical protein